MEGKLNININIEGTPILHFSTFTLEQRFNAHHYFELRFNHDEMGAPGLISLDKGRNYIGKSIQVQFGKPSGGEQQFVGKVTRVELSQSHGYHGTLIVSGYSPSILIDRGPDLGSYLNKDLKAIIRKATEDAPANDLSININPARKTPIDYVIQYRESDYEFLNRLSAEYHEWFYYDGTKLQFGKPDQQDDVKLVYGRDVHALQYAMQAAPLKSRKFFYSPAEDELFKAEAKAAASGQPDLAHAVNASNELYSKVYSQPLVVRADSRQDVETFVSNEDKANIADLLQITGSGDNPGVGLGKVVDVSMSVKEALSFSVQQLGRFLVTAVYHHVDGVGHYHNTFEGIVADTERIPVREYEKPLADMQLATVENNSDPKGQGRVKVKFKWECNCNDESEWLRVMTPDAGSSDKVSTNRGFVFIPENGDQVVVAFEEGNVARPFVLGSVHHGKNGTGGGSGNNGKSLSSKSGHRMDMNDGGAMSLMDKSKLQHITLDGVGVVAIASDQKITHTTGKLITLEAGDVKIIMDQDANKITFQAKNIEIKASDSFKVTGDGKPSLAGSLEFENNLTVFCKTDLMLTSDTKTTVNGKEMNVKGANTTIDGKPVKINS